MRIHYLQHVPFEGLGTIRKWAELKNHNISATRFFQGDTLIPVEEIDLLIVMGGPMGVYDEDQYPWLVKERDYITRAIKQKKKVLGICLGAQLVASALGAKVYPNRQKEIGWFPLKLTDEGKNSKFFSDFEEQFTAFHWHGDTFDLPGGTQLLAESEVCKHQAFIYDDRVLALQFHLEVEKENIESLIKNCGNELSKGPFIQSARQILEAKNEYRVVRDKMFQLLDQMEH